MKKTILTLVAAAALHTASAQNSAVTNAVLFQRQGTLDKARTEIDKAITNEKTSNKAKTWYTRGEIYDAMVSSPIYGKSLPAGEGAKVAFESYQKAIQLDGKDGEFGKKATEKLDGLYGLALNAGVENYNGKNYDEALKSYQMAQQIRPQDTTAYLYAAYAAAAKEDFSAAKDQYTKLQGIGYKSPQMYTALLQMARQEKNDAEASKVLQQALQAYPTNKAFMLEDLNADLSSGRSKEALAKIDKAIAADPKNANLYAVKGSLLDQAKQPAQALEAYKKAVEIEPENFDANFNLGVYNYNKAADLYTRASKMSLAEYQKTGKKYEADGKKYFQDSLPYFEKALQVQPNDRSTISSLQKAYLRVGRTADSERMAAKLEAAK
ncbi:tetratricopeptide repeat protein [Hymenobacter taeanensis]|uniref:Tetratricopeptide repeat protein n=1 Tax=Hymenobacter taeanensis TaxID=2735321 RepID=A0A6M6BMI8_9BACT|nr:MULTISPECIES: tetratricopeptide repeat protein [Hymenobacter]QJX48643.1 tetratricopeptide repeat protein [Hymenobacter taeanensis]UOQ81859.1 tetratricopeptide repeat protein [Hymenobacter sp. 5414T-23]